MSNPFKAIAISLLPNFSPGDLWVKEISLPENMVLFESGRVAEYLLLKSLGMEEGDEVIIQAFTCVAVPNSIIWSGAKPVYVDIDESLNLDPEKLKKAITPNTKAVIFQNTFGNPGQKEKVKEMCKREKIFFIDDCAHTAKTDCDLAFFSFGRDKVISGLYGGGAVVTKDKIQETRLRTQVKELETRNWAWQRQRLLYIFMTYFILQTYKFFGLGKIIHHLLKEFLPKALTSEEKQGKMPEKFFTAPPKVLAQLPKLDQFIAHRKNIAKFYAKEFNEKYDDNCSYLRFNIFVDDPDGLRKFAAKHAIFLGDWYDQVVAPKGVNLEAVGYKIGSCPKAEEVCKKIVNLPTNPNLSLEEAKKVVEIVKLWQQIEK